jgi:hypothetical protein
MTCAGKPEWEFVEVGGVAKGLSFLYEMGSYRCFA